MQSFADVIGLWKDAEEFAADVAILGVTARAWRNRGSIPSEHWKTVVEAAIRRGFHQVTLEALAELADRKRRERAA